uniref:EGF-like domain-containing protein n=1 Tax=Ditylenchus dipsaci TaxID=166011 RepID=A0A915DVY3_9BILA
MSADSADPSLPIFDPVDESESQAGIAVDRVPMQQQQDHHQLPSNTSQPSDNQSSRLRKIRRELKLLNAQLGGCDNNGSFVNGKCVCPYPFVGSRCAEFDCEHGLSVGPRFDPEETFFNRRCICEDDWTGELCNIPIADQCNGRGQYNRGRCKCHGYYFGPKCQYVSKCVNGKLQDGTCNCIYGYEGDYCDKIVCHHGYPDKANESESCVCPPRHTGKFCDECLLGSGLDSRILNHILPFPNCTEERIPYRARISRIVILLISTGLLFLLFLTMIIMHWGRRRALDPVVDVEKRRAVEERKELLERAIYLQSSRDSASNTAALLNSSGARRSSRFLDPNRMDHDLL